MSFAEAALIPHVTVIVSNAGVYMQLHKLVIKAYLAMMLFLRGNVADNGALTINRQSCGKILPRPAVKSGESVITPHPVTRLCFYGLDKIRQTYGRMQVYE